MADVEQKARAEAEKKGLSGAAEQHYVGGVFNRIRAAHSHATTPGKGARHLKRQARKEARAEAQNRNRIRDMASNRERLLLRTRTAREEPRERPQRPSVAKQSKFERMQARAHPNAAEIAREVAARNPQTAPAALPATAARTPKTKPSIADFTPVKRVDGLVFDGTKPLNPYLLYEAYGAAQFAQLLDFLSLARLKDSASVVEQRHPGTKPTSRGQKAAVIEYIVRHVAGEQPPTRAQPAAQARPAEKAEKVAAPPPPPAKEPEPRQLSYREQQWQRKHQWKFEQGERDRAAKREREDRYQRNLDLKKHGYQWKKIQDIGGPSDDGDNAGMVWQLYDPHGKPVSEAEAHRRINQK